MFLLAGPEPASLTFLAEHLGQGQAPIACACGTSEGPEVVRSFKAPESIAWLEGVRR